mmetsp:Transcript_36089/g.44036  ORF Transcript_36089/g.44036 Transcript_36089/m.44036 type:complete len:87 (-) Transcript_36089:635-895(-)
MRNSAAKQYRQNDCVTETPYESTVRNNIAVMSGKPHDGAHFTKGVSGSAPRKHNLKFDEEEELIGAFREYIRLELELDDAKARLAA